jgi:hypothetical protein
MKRSLFVAAAVSAAVGALTLSTLVSGNSRRTVGTLSSVHQAETPYVARLLGVNEVPAPGDPDGVGAAALSFQSLVGSDFIELCWDLSFSNIATPTGGHIHRGAPDVNGPIVAEFGERNIVVTSTCGLVSIDLFLEIQANPAGFYVNLHNPEFPAGAIRGQLAKGPEPAGPLHYLPEPLRAYDSRSAPGGKVTGGQTRTISLSAGKDGQAATQIAVPPGATGALVTITAVQTTGAGYLTVYSAASPLPPASSLNFGAAGAAVTVSTQVAVNAASEIKLTAGPAGFHVIIDVTGYTY